MILEMVGRVRFFLLKHIDYVSLNSNPWDGNMPSFGNSWEPRKSKMAAEILVNYKMCSSLHYIMLRTYFCTRSLGHMGNSMEPFIILSDYVHMTKIQNGRHFHQQ